jgi:cell division protein ZapA
VKQIEVQIMGQGYVLGCPEGGETRLGQAVGKVDEAMCKIRDAGKIKARDRIAVLAALNLAFEQNDAATDAENNAETASSSKLDADSAALSATDSERLGQLLKKLDQALHQDGQLI